MLRWRGGDRVTVLHNRDVATTLGSVEESRVIITFLVPASKHVRALLPLIDCHQYSIQYCALHGPYNKFALMVSIVSRDICDQKSQLLMDCAVVIAHPLSRSSRLTLFTSVDESRYSSQHSCSSRGYCRFRWLSCSAFIHGRLSCVPT